MAYCSNCGQKLPNDACFCPKCGFKTLGGVQANVKSPSEELKESFSKMGVELEKAFNIAAKEIHDAFETARKNIQQSTSGVPIVCSNCGEKNQSGAVFCFKCGKKLASPSVNPQDKK